MSSFASFRYNFSSLRPFGFRRACYGGRFAQLRGLIFFSFFLGGGGGVKRGIRGSFFSSFFLFHSFPFFIFVGALYLFFS